MSTEPSQLDRIEAVGLETSQLDRIEGKLNQLWTRVDTLERRASFWGAFGGAIALLTTKLAGCV